MSAALSAFPILRTKLHRPPVAADLVTRDELLERLEAGRHLPLTLVSAPAGYGKTTLISHWLEASKEPSAWVSLDETDGSVEAFLRYLVAAVRTLFPEACSDLLSWLSPGSLPAVPVLAGLLCNDLDEIGQPIVLVLDDFHRIREPAVSELLDRLLRHPPRGLHLALLTRRDPPLSLVTLRAQHRMTEIRFRDLQFSGSESARFLESATGRAFEGQALSRLQASTEGWPVALRLAAAALRHGSDRVVEIAQGLGDSREVREYLVTEVLDHLSPTVRDWLCRTSILARFCAPLCEAVCQNGAADGPSLGGSEFLHVLEEEGLLSVALDERHQWFRYHHLFQESLQRRLFRERGAASVVGLHVQAAAWLEGRGLIEEALHHLLAAEDSEAAGRLIVRCRGDIAEHEQWHRLDRWLSLLPARLVAGDPELMILKVWAAEYRARYGEIPRLLGEVEAMIAARPLDDANRDRLLGEIAALRGRDRYAADEVEQAQRHAEEALRLLPPASRSERAWAKMILGGTLQRQGESRRASIMLHDALEQEARDSPAFRGRILFTLCVVQWAEADLVSLGQTSDTMLRLGEEHRLEDTIHSAKLFRAITRYHHNHLAATAELLTPLVSRRSALRVKLIAHSAFALALVHHAEGRDEQARGTLESLSQRLLASGNTALLPLARGFQADLALRQGRLAEALRWVDSYDAQELPKGLELHWLEFTAVRALLEQATPAALARGTALLGDLGRYFQSVHNRRFLIDVEALQALLHDARGKESAALAALERAVGLAQPGRWLRPFVDLGPGLARLFRRLRVVGDTRRYVAEILAAFPSEAPVAGPGPLLEPLTPRELEVLSHVARRLSNKEIGAHLGISSVTVKRHTNNIYGKLGVNGRWEAAAKAKALGLLAAD